MAYTSVATPADFFVNPSAVDDSGDGLTISTPKKFIASASALAVAGSIIELADGVYDNALDEVTHTNIARGTTGNWVVYRAANDGQAVIEQNLAVNETSANLYTIFEGLKWKTFTSKSIQGNYWKFFRTAFEGGPLNSLNQVGMAASFCSNGLFEDCWFYGGGGRYKLLVYIGDNIITRRCVARNDGGWNTDAGNGSDPETPFIYYGSSGYIQDSIVADATFNSTGGAGGLGCFTVNNNGGDAGGVTNMHGTIAINSAFTGYGVEGDGTAITGGDIENFVATGCTGNGVVLNSSGLTAINFSRGCLNNNSGGDGAADYSSTTGDAITRTIISNHSSEALRGINNSSYNNVYGNGGGDSGTGTTTYDPRVSGSLYPVRRETGSQLETDDAGATILNRMGVSGTLFGETGYDTLTGEALWPFPNEARILSDFRSIEVDAGTGIVSGDRGFALTGATSIDGTPQTLTKYIWEAFGNQAPSEFNTVEVPTAVSIGATTASAGALQAYATSITITVSTELTRDEIAARIIDTSLILILKTVEADTATIKDTLQGLDYIKKLGL